MDIVAPAVKRRRYSQQSIGGRWCVDGLALLMLLPPSFCCSFALRSGGGLSIGCYGGGCVGIDAVGCELGAKGCYRRVHLLDAGWVFLIRYILPLGILAST
jgi:hypothetical protein